MTKRSRERNSNARGAAIGAICLLVGLFRPDAAEAQNEAKLAAALNNLQADLSICIAYYSILKECSAGEDEGRRPAQPAIDDLTRKSEAAADALRMPSADVAMRLELNLAGQRHFIQGSCRRKAILVSRYADQCDALVLDDPVILKHPAK
jgi:hypothetical protein